MNTIITIEGMRKLKETALSGGKLPKTWRMDIEKYLTMKKRAVDMNKVIYLKCLKKLEEGLYIKGVLYSRNNR